MTNETEHPEQDPVPPFVRRLVASYPASTPEDLRELRQTFINLSTHVDEVAQTASDFLLVYRTSVLVCEMQRREQMRQKIIRHHHFAAVTSLLARVYHPDAEKGSIAEKDRQKLAQQYFASDNNKASLTEVFTCAGYESDAVETEAFLHSQSHLGILDREIAGLNKQLLSNFRELDRRYARRAADAIKKEATNIIARARGDKKAG